MAVVLDAGALDGTPYSPSSRALIERALDRGGEIWCCAVNLAEVCRGRDRSSRVASFLRRGIQVAESKHAVNVRATDEGFARRVGALLHAASLNSSSLADGHVIALCAEFDTAIVLTTDPDDIIDLSQTIPSVRVVTRRP